MSIIVFVFQIYQNHGFMGVVTFYYFDLHLTVFVVVDFCRSQVNGYV